MKADSMVTSDFESAHAFPVKPEIIGFKRFKNQTYIFYHPHLCKQICWVQKWMLFFGPPTHFRFKPEIIGFIPLKALTWIFFDPYLLKQTHWVQKWMFFSGQPTHFRFKPEIIGFRHFKSQTAERDVQCIYVTYNLERSERLNEFRLTYNHERSDGLNRSSYLSPSLDVIGSPRCIKPFVPLEVVSWQGFIKPLAFLEVVGSPRYIKAAFEVVDWKWSIKILASPT